MLTINKVKKKLNYAWRVGATGFSFASFGLGGIVIGGVVAPLVKVSTFDTRKRQDRAQKAIKYSFKGFTEMMVKLGIMTYEVEGLEKLAHSRQELVIANHPTLIDVVILIGLMEKANCIVKKALSADCSMCVFSLNTSCQNWENVLTLRSEVIHRHFSA